MSTDRDTALDELATVVAEATVDAWLAGELSNTDCDISFEVVDSKKQAYPRNQARSDRLDKPRKLAVRR